MKIYLATPFGLAEEAKRKAAQLKSKGHSITHEWWLDPPLPGNGRDPATAAECARRASADLQAVLRAEAVVVLAGASGTGGVHVETGYALAHGKRVILVGAPENVLGWLIGERYETWEEFLEALND
jgi:nucleoside 2-deoxyribosyltransferase